MLRKNQGVGGIWGGGEEYSDVLDGFGGLRCSNVVEMVALFV